MTRKRYRKKILPKEKIIPKEEIIPKPSLILLLISLVVYVISWFGSVIIFSATGAMTNVILLLVYVCIGGIIFIPFYILIKRKNPNEENGWSFYLFLGFCALIPAIALIINKNNIISSKCDNYIILDKGTITHVGKLPITILIESSKEEVYISKIEWDRFNLGDSVNVCIEKGALGFDYANINE